MAIYRVPPHGIFVLTQKRDVLFQCGSLSGSRRADGQWPPLRQYYFGVPHFCRGEHRSSATRRCPTGGNGNDRSVSRLSPGGRPMAAPTGAIIKPFCHSENGKIPKTSAENNRADAKTTTAVFNADSSPAAAGRAGAKTTTAVFNADRFPAAAGH